MKAPPGGGYLCSEIQPLKCRDFGITWGSTTTNRIEHYITPARDIPDLLLGQSIGAAGKYSGLYTALNIAFIGITFWLIPKPKNVTEHIERKLMAGEKLRNIGVYHFLPCRSDASVIRHDGAPLSAAVCFIAIMLYKRRAQ